MTEQQITEEIVAQLCEDRMREILGPVLQNVKDRAKRRFTDSDNRKKATLSMLRYLHEAATKVLCENIERAERQQEE